jgi:hypothetical protein
MGVVVTSMDGVGPQASAPGQTPAVSGERNILYVWASDSSGGPIVSGQSSLRIPSANHRRRGHGGRTLLVDSGATSGDRTRRPSVPPPPRSWRRTTMVRR